MLQFPADAETVTPGNTFFRHMKRGACATGPETEEHLELKRIVVEAARRRGWTADTEVTGITRAGEQWRVDVLAQNDPRKVAIEIQWSGQSNDETWRRQERYKRCHIRGLWLKPTDYCKCYSSALADKVANNELRSLAKKDQSTWLVAMQSAALAPPHSITSSASSRNATLPPPIRRASLANAMTRTTIVGAAAR